MKHRAIAVIVPALVGVTLVGTGFSVWYFADNNSSNRKQDVSLNLKVTGAASIGSITIPDKDSYNLTFDAPKDTDSGIHLNNSGTGNQNVGQTSNNTSSSTTASSVTHTQDQIDGITVSYTTEGDVAELAKSLVLTMTVTITDGSSTNAAMLDETPKLSDYLEFSVCTSGSGTPSWTNSSGTYTYTMTLPTNGATGTASIADATSTTHTIEVTAPKFSFNWKEKNTSNGNQNGLENERMDPKTMDEWSKMNSAVTANDAGVSIHFSLDWAE